MIARNRIVFICFDGPLQKFSHFVFPKSSPHPCSEFLYCDSFFVVGNTFKLLPCQPNKSFAIFLLLPVGLRIFYRDSSAGSGRPGRWFQPYFPYQKDQVGSLFSPEASRVGHGSKRWLSQCFQGYESLQTAPELSCLYHLQRQTPLILVFKYYISFFLAIK